MKELFIVLILSIVISASIFYDVFKLSKTKEENQEKIKCQIISISSDKPYPGAVMTIKFETMTSTVELKKSINLKKKTIKCYTYQGELYLDKFEVDKRAYIAIYVIVLYTHLFLLFILSMFYVFKKNSENNEV